MTGAGCDEPSSHGIPNPFIEFGDSLLYPRFIEGGRLKRFDAVLINPPWNQDGYGEETLKRADFRERFSFGCLPTRRLDWSGTSGYDDERAASSTATFPTAPEFQTGVSRRARRQHSSPSFHF